MRRATKNDIIHINLNYESIIALLEGKSVLLAEPILKPFASKKSFQALIPSSMGLFQTIQSFLKFENMVWKLGIFKARGLPNKNFFLYVPIQENTLHIHLIQFEPFQSCKR